MTFDAWLDWLLPLATLLACYYLITEAKGRKTMNIKDITPEDIARMQQERDELAKEAGDLVENIGEAIRRGMVGVAFGRTKAGGRRVPMLLLRNPEGSVAAIGAVFTESFGVSDLIATDDVGHVAMFPRVGNERDHMPALSPDETNGCGDPECPMCSKLPKMPASALH